MSTPEKNPPDAETTPHPDISRQSPWRLLGRALLLRCPNCGAKHIFTGFFVLKERCPNCGILLERGESDAWLGAYTDRKSTRLNSSHVEISYAVFCLKKK